MRGRDYKDIKEEGEYVILWDEKAQAPYLADGEGTLMLGFDNPKSLKIKCDYLKANGLLGAMYWDYEGDNEAGDLQKTLATELL